MTVFLADEQEVPVPTEDLRELACAVLDAEGYPERVEVTILLVDDDTMTGYNESFMGRDGPTDVLAFPLEELVAGQAPSLSPHDPPIHLGDIVISPDYVQRQAADRGVEFLDELSLMVVHGMLHLMGWDHPDEEIAERMERREAEILSSVGRSRP
jgi:probable rRNA maturation factor